MNGVLSHNSALVRLYRANEMNFVMKHAPGAGSLAGPVNLQSSGLPTDDPLELDGSHIGCLTWPC